MGSDSKNGVRHQRALSPRLSMMMMMFLRLLAGLLWVAFKDKVKANIDTVIPLAKNCSLRTVAYADIIDMVLT